MNMNQLADSVKLLYIKHLLSGWLMLPLRAKTHMSNGAFTHKLGWDGLGWATDSCC